MKDLNYKNADILVKSGCYVNANNTQNNKIITSNGDIVMAYLSCRLAISNVKVREYLEEQLVKSVKNNFNEKDLTIVGTATAGITWAHSIAQSLKLPLLYTRSRVKDYGLNSLIEGNLDNAYKKAIIVDDVLYTGNTINYTISTLKNAGINTIGVVCIATLRDNIVEDLKSNDIKVLNLTDYKNLLDSALENEILNKQEFLFMQRLYKNKTKEERK